MQFDLPLLHLRLQAEIACCFGKVFLIYYGMPKQQSEKRWLLQPQKGGGNTGGCLF
jgi:hypothetical protein